MRLLCPAKINLHLRVGPVRGDGFHPLLSWFCIAGLFDTLTLEQNVSPVPNDEEAYVTLRCDQADLPLDRRNLVVKVGDAFAGKAAIAGGRVFPVHAHLQKRIPAGAGLGGGSSDGARMLLGLNRVWRVEWSANLLSGFAAQFGSDLPFFLFGPSSICKGRGEIVEPIARPHPRSVLMILPPIVMPTAEVYRRFDALNLGRNEDVEREPDWLAWSKLDARALLGQLVNDLETPAFSISPPLKSLRDRLAELLSRPVRMSGSGSSLFTIYDTDEESKLAREKIEQLMRIRVETAELAPDFVDDLNTNR